MRLWQRTYRADPAVARLASRHYSAHQNRYARDGKRKFDLPGQVLHLVIPGARWPFEVDAGWVWWRPPSDQRIDGYGGWYHCALFRNESEHLSSLLVSEAVEWARETWGEPDHGFDTYVWPARIRSTNPGWCYQVAGWQKDGWSRDGKKRRLYLPAGSGVGHDQD